MPKAVTNYCQRHNGILVPSQVTRTGSWRVEQTPTGTIIMWKKESKMWLEKFQYFWRPKRTFTYSVLLTWTCSSKVFCDSIKMSNHFYQNRPLDKMAQVNNSHLKNEVNWLFLSASISWRPPFQEKLYLKWRKYQDSYVVKFAEMNFFKRGLNVKFYYLGSGTESKKTVIKYITYLDRTSVKQHIQNWSLSI